MNNPERSDGCRKRPYVWYLLFWPVFGLRYILLERFVVPERYIPVSCPLDDWIPFNEGFLIPYVLWYLFIIGIHLYTFLYDSKSFQRYTRYMVVVFSISTLTFLLFPTCQNLRPADFPRDNFLTDAVRMLYMADTNTNVCPSEHVIGSVAAFLAVCNTKSLRKPWLIACFAALAVFTSLATVFLKQHSLVDVAAAILVCILGAAICRIWTKKTGAV